MEKRKINDIDEYISMFPDDIQKILITIRHTIQKAAPEAQEKISYQMPAYSLNGNLVYFAAFKNHIGFYPTPSGITAFKDELSSLGYSKGAIRFPIDKPIPIDLITRIVKYRIKENMKKGSK